MARFLVIDDDNTMRGLIVATLENAGHVVSQAASGREAVALCRLRPVDVVITDIVMPEDSLEMVVELRNEHPKIPFIVVSGLLEKSSRTLEIAHILGARRTLAKPFKLDELLGVSAEVLAEQDIRPPTPKRKP